MAKNKIGTPLTYYGGKQNLIKVILPLIPPHHTYVEPFVGGGAIFWAKPPSKVEVINDYNRELINFYEVVKNEFVDLEKMIRITLHSRSLHSDASVIYNNGHLFTRIQRAWAVWVLCSQSFSSLLDGPWGYDRIRSTTSSKVANKRDSFSEQYAIRLQNVQLENTDALRIINSRDYEDAFHYCDPPYFNSDCGHYDGYSRDDYKSLLDCLSNIKGKFLLSSYPSKELEHYVQGKSWCNVKVKQTIHAGAKHLHGQSRGKKVEMLTANYDLYAMKGMMEL